MYFVFFARKNTNHVFQIQNTNMYFKYVFQILVFEILPSTAKSQAVARIGDRTASQQTLQTSY